jgi:hypothetical protein
MLSWPTRRIRGPRRDELPSGLLVRSSFVLFFKILKPFAAGAQLCPLFLSRCRFCTFQSSFSWGKTRSSSLDQSNFQVIRASVQHDLVSFGEERERASERERERECVCVCMLFFFKFLNSFLFPSELRKLRRIRDRELLDWVSFPLFLRVFWL